MILADDGKTYNRVQIYTDKKQTRLLGEATVGNWIDDARDTFNMGNRSMDVSYYLYVMDLAEDGSALKMYYSYALRVDDDSYVVPSGLKKELFDKLGAPVMLSAMSHDDPEKLAVMVKCADKGFTWCMDAN